jgi:hypothetical protein
VQLTAHCQVLTPQSQGIWRARIKQRGKYAHISLRLPPIPPGVALLGRLAVSRFDSLVLSEAPDVSLCLCSNGEGIVPGLTILIVLFPKFLSAWRITTRACSWVARPAPRASPPARVTGQVQGLCIVGVYKGASSRTAVAGYPPSIWSITPELMCNIAGS